MYVVGLNGPPHSGKDSIAVEIAAQLPFLGFDISVYVVGLIRPLRFIGMNMLGLEPKDDAAYAMAKETQCALFNGDTFRQFMIKASEQFFKKEYGQDFWTQQLKVDCREIWNKPCLVLIPDLGFQFESNFFVREIGEENFLLVQLERNGCDFSKDSRGYVHAPNLIQIRNNQSLGWAAQAIIARMNKLGWTL